MKRLSVLASGLLLAVIAACSPTEMADKVGRRAAESVVLPVVSKSLAGPAADTATRCIVDNASAEDIQLLARDVGVVAGTSTVATIRRLSGSPGPASCMAQAGVPAFGVQG